MTESIDPDGPSPWWPCPECGGLHFRTVCTFERGKWEPVDSGYEWRAFDPPSGTPTGVYASNVECVSCGHTFDIARHYGWPIVGQIEATE